MPEHEQTETDEAAPPESGRERLIAALRHPTRGQLGGAALLAVLGFAAVVQVQSTDEEDNFAGTRQADLIALINNLSLNTDRAEAELADLRETRDTLRTDSEASRTALELARQRLDALEILTGTAPAVGPGIRVTVAAEEGQIGTEPVLNALQELRDAGAEATEVNDTVRVVADTAIEFRTGEGLFIGGRLLSPPYSIDVIGDPDTLAEALTFPGGFVVEIEQVGGEVDVETSDRVEVSSLHDLPEARYAQPVPQE